MRTCHMLLHRFIIATCHIAIIATCHMPHQATCHMLAMLHVTCHMPHHIDMPHATRHTQHAGYMLPLLHYIANAGDAFTCQAAYAITATWPDVTCHMPHATRANRHMPHATFRSHKATCVTCHIQRYYDRLACH
jgi:hypothetical protein